MGSLFDWPRWSEQQSHPIAANAGAGPIGGVVAPMLLYCSKVIFDKRYLLRIEK